jgi:hypothetical protein
MTGRARGRTTATGDGVTTANVPADDSPARTIEIERLTKERDKLRKALDEAGGAVDELVTLHAEVQALKTVAARFGISARPRHMSEGVREEIERVGFSTDPHTNRVLTREDLPS